MWPFWKNSNITLFDVTGSLTVKKHGDLLVLESTWYQQSYILIGRECTLAGAPESLAPYDNSYSLKKKNYIIEKYILIYKISAIQTKALSPSPSPRSKGKLTSFHLFRPFSVHYI